MDNATPRRHAPGLSRREAAALALGAVILPIARPALARGIETPATAEDEKFMRLAIEEAAQGDYPFGAVIVANGEVLARGRNLGIKEKDPTAHGEMVAIRNFLAAHGPDKLKGTTLYTSAESCPMCMGAIVWCGISRVVFGASIAQLATKIGQIMVTDAEIAAKTPFADIALTGGVLAAESLKLFK
ncbi:nucleoside deaminase [Methyloceanibacter sp.]|uniref:nucleoside deaminase n=1 Tax=Methyloceanibacter sp. TaxID=1965321 RepID=UPI002D44A834|nr:nucleoside deaminase [Methyloceanibacter sp.]HZP08029.1 nucleoside deaminase [Methyloceanibacter sp.]